jgi:hypothetical protein
VTKVDRSVTGGREIQTRWNKTNVGLTSLLNIADYRAIPMLLICFDIRMQVSVQERTLGIQTISQSIEKKCIKKII